MQNRLIFEYFKGTSRLAVEETSILGKYAFSLENFTRINIALGQQFRKKFLRSGFCDDDENSDNDPNFSGKREVHQEVLKMIQSTIGVHVKLIRELLKSYSQVVIENALKQIDLNGLVE